MLPLVILDSRIISIEAALGFTQNSDTIHAISLTKAGRCNNPPNNEVGIQIVRVTMHQALKDGISNNRTSTTILPELWLSVTWPTVSDI